MGDLVDNEDRTLKVDGLVNGRDLGGLKRADGTVTPSGVFFRSENVDRITGNGWQQIHDAGIRTVVDLRQQRERNTDTRERPSWLTTIHELMLEELCRQHGTTTEGAFRNALAKFDLQTFLDAAEFTDEDRKALFTWRGATITPPNPAE